MAKDKKKEPLGKAVKVRPSTYNKVKKILDPTDGSIGNYFDIAAQEKIEKDKSK
jgi:hypothetical protein